MRTQGTGQRAATPADIAAIVKEMGDPAEVGGFTGLDNWTGHSVQLYALTVDTVIRSLDPAGMTRVDRSSVIQRARAAGISVVRLGGVEVEGVPLTTCGRFRVTNPPPIDGKLHILSLDAAIELFLQTRRGDIAHLVDMVRSPLGRVIGARQLVRFGS